MAEMARVFGQGGEVEHKGKTYSYKPLNMDMLSMFETWLENRAWTKVERTRGQVPDVIYRERLDAVARLVASDTFAFGSDTASQAASSEEGRRYLWWLQLSAGSKEMTRELADEIYEADVDRAIARMEAANGDPNSKAPTGEDTPAGAA